MPKKLPVLLILPVLFATTEVNELLLRRDRSDVLITRVYSQRTTYPDDTVDTRR